MTLAITNGKVITNGRLEKANLLIENGRIAEVTDKTVSATDRIDASGKIVLPGLIDCHVHLREPGMTNKEDFRTGSMAAAAGGVTSVFDMPNTIPATTTVANLEEKRELAARSIVNYGLYVGATEDNAEEIAAAKNVPGVKVYMGSSTGNMLLTDRDAIRKVFSMGKKVVVHAEDQSLMQKNAERFKNEKSPAVHAKIRSSETETSAVRQAVGIAGGNRIHLTHVSAKGSIEIIKGLQNVSCDVTPHHLFLTHEELKKQGNFAKMNPALRSQEDVNALWTGINEGIVDCIATDHAPHSKDDKEADYRDAPAGVPGLETMLPLLLDAVNKGRITLEKVAELTSASPARLFGLKSKGKIAAGMDADLVIADMETEREVKNEELFTKCGWSPFAGRNLRGWPVTTIVNGKIIFNEGETCDVKAREVEFG